MASWRKVSLVASSRRALALSTEPLGHLAAPSRGTRLPGTRLPQRPMGLESPPGEARSVAWRASSQQASLNPACPVLVAPCDDRCCRCPLGGEDGLEHQVPCS